MGICSYFTTSCFTTPLLGLDIQPASIKAIQLKKMSVSGPKPRATPRFKIEKIASTSLPAGVFADDTIRQPEVFHSILAELVQLNGFTDMDTAICLPVNRTRMQQCQVPAGMPGPLIQSEIMAQVKRDFPGMEEALYLDFTIDASAQQSDVFFVVAKQEYVSRLMAPIFAAKLAIKIVDIDICALMRALLYPSSVSPFLKTAGLGSVPGAIGFLWVIDHSSALVISDTKKILFHQKWDLIDNTSYQTQLKNRIPYFFEILERMQVKQLIIYDTHHELANMVREENKTKACLVHSVTPLLELVYDKSVQEKILAEGFSGFLLACGLAMREVPVW